MDHRDHHRGLAGPFQPPRCARNRSAIRQNWSKSCRARIALADRVGRDQPEHAAVSEEAESTAKEVRDEISISMRTFVQRLQPRQIVFDVSLDDRILAGKRRIADDGVEAAILASEHLRKLDLPMKWWDWMLARREARRKWRDRVDPAR